MWHFWLGKCPRDMNILARHWTRSKGTILTRQTVNKLWSSNRVGNTTVIFHSRFKTFKSHEFYMIISVGCVRDCMQGNINHVVSCLASWKLCARLASDHKNKVEWEGQSCSVTFPPVKILKKETQSEMNSWANALAMFMKFNSIWFCVVGKVPPQCIQVVTLQMQTTYWSEIDQSTPIPLSNWSNMINVSLFSKLLNFRDSQHQCIFSSHN